MVDVRVEKLAELCVNYSVEVKLRGKVLISGSEIAIPFNPRAVRGMSAERHVSSGF